MKKMFHFDQSSPLLIHLIVTDCYFSHNEQYYKFVVFLWVVPSLLLLPTYSWNIQKCNDNLDKFTNDLLLANYPKLRKTFTLIEQNILDLRDIT